MQHANFMLLLILLKVFDLTKYHWCFEKI